jgi:hypothetical protein
VSTARRRLVIAFFFIASTGTALSGQGMQAPPSDALVAAILRGDPDVMLRAAATGDKRLIPYLRVALDRMNAAGEPLANQALYALGRLDDTEQQQKLWCEAQIQGGRPGDFQIIGGWFGIQALSRIVSGEAKPTEPRRIIKRIPGDDTMWVPPDVQAFSPLLELIPEAASRPGYPSALVPGEYSREVLDWIGAHRGELMRSS